jgi:predicted house-cleaning NTP pyrophosphatase (Maf/HAM1 superfamily)
MEYANHTARTITTRQAAEQAARHIVGVIRTVGPERSMWILADTLPHWTAESYTKAADPNQHANLIKHLEERITITYPRTQP